VVPVPQTQLDILCQFKVVGVLLELQGTEEVTQNFLCFQRL